MKFIPHEYQRYCINRMLSDKALGLFLDMGLGKTVITLTAINDLKYNRFEVSKILVVAPKKVAETTWGKEASKWDHLQLLRVITVLGSQSRRIRALNTPADIYVINRENVPWLVEYYRNAWPFDMVIVDEFSSFKSHQAKRFKSLTWVRDKIYRFVGLTGTPAPNGLLDLWAQVYLLDKGERLGKKITHYRERYFEPDQRDRDHVFSYAPKPGAEEAIKTAISDICVSMKAEDYLQLPDCLSVTVPVVLDDKAVKAYEKLEKEMLLTVDENTIDAGSAAVLTNKLLQLCNGAVYDENREVVEIHNCKLEAFTELVEALNGQPALVFYNFQHDKARIIKATAKMGLEVRELKTPQDADDWNSRQIDILLAHPASAAYGLNLQEGGNHVIWFGLNWSLELYQQANARLHRQGQKEKVIIHHLVVEGGRDEDVIEALEDKSATQESLMQSLKARIDKYK
ncbi:DEAD/DEAH box helicase [Aminipila sp.]|uniref:DEAD/DEAH box helicase n=1 Tax=Aminipila sp. TaxID=2060095 RepID=UPI002896A8EB|nr:DEAD/DEAH box helicase [Aminipila sp.]